MGSLNKKLERTQLKMAYKNFCKQWQAESKKEGADKKKFDRRPTFNMYMNFYRQAQENAREMAKKALEEMQAQDEKIDTSWEEHSENGT